jgi:DNA-binding FadR family transcriptional regulator
MKTAEAIHGMIRARNLRPGEQLPAQRDLAAELGVSRPSLREALSMLETLGVISVEAGRGVFVAREEGRVAAPESWRFGAQYSLREVFEIRRAIEGGAAELAVMQMTAQDLEEIEAMCREITAAAAERNVLLVAENDARFHDFLFARCGNRLFQAIYAQMGRLMTESQQVPMLARERLIDTALEHRRVVDACHARNPESTRSAMERHISGAAARVGINL